MKVITPLALAAFTAALLGSAFAEPTKPIRMITPITPARTIMLQTAKVPPPPRAFTRQDTAAYIAKELKLSVPPMVGAPVALTPSKMAIPGLAYFRLQDVYQFDGIEASEVDATNSTGVVSFNRTHLAMAYLSFKTLPGKRYAIDCRIDAPRLYYQIQVNATWQTASLGADGSKHFLFVTPTATGVGWQSVLLHFNESAQQLVPSTVYLWGCEISPF